MKIYGLVTKVMADIGSISKEKKNLQQGYMFRGIDDMYNAIYPAFCKHGLFTVPTVLESSREERPSKSGGMLIYTTVKVNYKLFADDGSFIDAICIGEGMDSGDKSANKAMAAAHKYFFMQTFCIPTEEIKDSEIDSPEVAVPAKPVVPTIEKPPSPNDAMVEQDILKSFELCQDLKALAKAFGDAKPKMVNLPKASQQRVIALKDKFKETISAFSVK